MATPTRKAQVAKKKELKKVIKVHNKVQEEGYVEMHTKLAGIVTEIQSQRGTLKGIIEERKDDFNTNDDLVALATGYSKAITIVDKKVLDLVPRLMTTVNDKQVKNMSKLKDLTEEDDLMEALDVDRQLTDCQIELASISAINTMNILTALSDAGSLDKEEVAKANKEINTELGKTL